MKKETKTIWVEQLVLVQDPILGSKYELQMVEVEDIEPTETVTKAPKKATKKAPKKAPKNEQ
jgi:hypothetical protein